MIAPLEGLANFYYYTKVQYDQVAPLYQWILNIVQAGPAPENANVAVWSRNLAVVYRLDNQNTMAETFYKLALAEIETATNSTEADSVQYLQGLAEFYQAWNKCEEAEPLAKRALAIREKAAASDTEPDAQLDVAVCCDSLGQLYLAWNKPGLAETCYNRSLGIVEKITGAESPDLTPRLMGLAAALRSQKQYDKASAQYQRALAISEKASSLGATQPALAAILEKYAAMLQDMNKPDEAKALLARAESLREHD
jgi:tetratricopeptide (TPR) repeat protein